MRIIKTNILNPLSWDKSEYLKNYYLSIKDDKIVEISTDLKNQNNYIEDFTNYICYPGFIDLHSHIYQYNIRGSYKNQLLEWLSLYTFPEEIKTSDPNYCNSVADIMINDLIKCGTSTSSIYSTIYPDSFRIVASKFKSKGLRCLLGKVMMDMNSPVELTENTEDSFTSSLTLYNECKNEDLIDYNFTPRFALSCTSNLMSMVGAFIKENPCYVQTHLSENKDEVSSVKKYFKNAKSYTDVYDQAGLLTPLTLLAHAIHLNDNELSIIQSRKSSIVHCPDSNYFLKSGAFPLKKILEYNIPFGLGSDVGAGTNLYMPYHAKMMIYRQDSIFLTPNNAFYSFTLGSAKALRKSHLIGSISVGKKADLVFIKQDTDSTDPIEIISKLIFTTCKYDVKKLIVNGNDVF